MVWVDWIAIIEGGWAAGVWFHKKSMILTRMKSWNVTRFGRNTKTQRDWQPSLITVDYRADWICERKGRGGESPTAHKELYSGLLIRSGNFCKPHLIYGRGTMVTAMRLSQGSSMSLLNVSCPLALYLGGH